MRTPIRKKLEGAFLLSAGQVTGYGLSFLRNLILARMLTKADFGLAAAFSISMLLLDLVSRMAFSQQIIQAREGEELSFQAVAHAVQASTGLISSVLLLTGAYPLAVAFGVPEMTWAFASLALVPLARGAMHLDTARLQRKFNFGPAVMSEIIPQGIATAAAWPLAAWLGDFRAVLWILLGKEFSAVALTHLLADRPYRLAWRPPQVRGMMAFSWPLLLNGLVMFAAQQADQMVIGGVFSLADLGAYSIAFTLPSVAFFIFAQVASSLMLPTLAGRQDDRAGFEKCYHRCMEMAVVASLAVFAPLVMAGGDIVRFLYGAKYHDLDDLVAIFSIMAAMRLFRWSPAVASMSCADTKNQLIGNIARSVSLPIVLAVIALGNRDMEAIAMCGLAGEALAILISLLRIRERQGIGFKSQARPFLYFAGWVGVGMAINILWRHSAHTGMFGTLLLWGAGAVTAFYLFPDLRHISHEALSELRAMLVTRIRSL